MWELNCLSRALSRKSPKAGVGWGGGTPAGQQAPSSLWIQLLSLSKAILGKSQLLSLQSPRAFYCGNKGAIFLTKLGCLGAPLPEAAFGDCSLFWAHKDPHSWAPLRNAGNDAASYPQINNCLFFAGDIREFTEGPCVWERGLLGRQAASPPHLGPQCCLQL